MRKSTIVILPLLILFAGCASEQSSILDRELAVYRFEQEKYRRKDLQKMYQSELARSDDLTQKILSLRKQVREQEADVAKLDQRLTDLEKARAEAQAKLKAAEERAAREKAAAEKAAKEKAAKEKAAKEKAAKEKAAKEKAMAAKKKTAKAAAKTPPSGKKK